MKARILTYLILLPFILLVAWTPISSWLSYAGWVALGLSVLLLIYMAIKTRAFYRTKKVLFFALFGVLSLQAAYAQTLYAHSQNQGAFNPQATVDKMEARDPSIKETSKCITKTSEFEKLQTERDKLLKKNEDDLSTSEKKELAKLTEKLEKAQQEMTSLCKQGPCVPVDQLYEEAVNKCWICEVAALFIEAGDKVATLFFLKVQGEGYAMSLLMMGLFFWILMRVLSLVGSFGAADIGKFFTELFVKCLLAGAVAIMLIVPLRDTANFFLSPFFLVSSTINQETLSFSKEISSDVVKLDVVMADQFGKMVQCPYCKNFENSAGYTPDPNISAAVGYNASSDERAVAPVLSNSILCSVCSLYKVTTPPVIAGQFLFCSASQLQHYDYRLTKLTYDNWDAILVGLALTFAFTLIAFIFAFYMIDSFVRICYVLILYPFLLVAYVFKTTRQYTKRAFDMLLHAMVTYIILGIVMVLIIQIFYVMISPVAEEMVNALRDENAYGALLKFLTFQKGSGVILLASVVIVFITFFLLQDVYGYVADLTGIDLKIGGGVGATMATVGAAAAVTHTIGEVMSNPAGWTHWRRGEVNPETGEFEYKGGMEAKSRAYNKYVQSKYEGAVNYADSVINNWNPNFRNWEQRKLDEARNDIQTKGFFGRIAGRLKYAGVKIAATARKGVSVSWWGRRISAGSIRSTARLSKAIARNRYVDRLVSFGWSTGSDAINYVGKPVYKGTAFVGRKAWWLGRKAIDGVAQVLDARRYRRH